MGTPQDARDETGSDAGMGGLSRRRAVFAGAAVTGAAWVAPGILRTTVAGAETSDDPCATPGTTTTRHPLTYTLADPEVRTEDVTGDASCIDVMMRVRNPDLPTESRVVHPRALPPTGEFTLQIGFGMDECGVYTEIRRRFQDAADDVPSGHAHTLSSFTLVARGIRTAYPLPANVTLVSQSIVAGPPGATVGPDVAGNLEIVVPVLDRTDGTLATCPGELVIEATFQHDGSAGPVLFHGPTCHFDETDARFTLDPDGHACGIIVRNWRDETAQPVIARIENCTT